MFDQHRYPARPQHPARTACTILSLTTALLAPTVLADPAGLLAARPVAWSSADAADSDRFGAAVALDADRVAIGATAVDVPTDGAGAVYVFDRDGAGWQESAVLHLEGVGVDARFGSAVALEDDWLAAGGSGVYAGAGAIYLFQHEGEDWQQRHRFLLPESQDFTFFGSTLDMNGEVLIAGAAGFDAGATDSGIVMLYERTEDGTWAESGQLQPENPEQGERFGSAVALHGNRAVVGADGAGAAYVFERNGDEWEQVAHLSEDVGERGGFGASVALSDSMVLVGAPFAENASGESPGAAFLYAEQGGSWERQATLLSDAPGRSDQVGAAVALIDGMALVSSPRDDADADDGGAVLVYAPDGGNWAFTGRLSSPDPGAYDEFGRSLAVDAEAGVALVGTPEDAVPGGNDGEYPGTVTAFQW